MKSDEKISSVLLFFRFCVIFIIIFLLNIVEFTMKLVQIWTKVHTRSQSNSVRISIRFGV